MTTSDSDDSSELYETDGLGPLPGDLRKETFQRKNDVVLGEPIEEEKQEAQQHTKRCCKCTLIVVCWRSLINTPNNFPRSFSIVFRILLPLVALIAIAVLCGHFLAQFESPYEYDTNDVIIATRFVLEYADLGETAERLVELPLHCFEKYLETQNIKETNLTWLDLLELHTVDPVDPGKPGFDGPFTKLTLAEILVIVGKELANFRLFMDKCGSGAEILVEDILELRDSIPIEIAIQETTFDWIRCWNETEIGSQDSYAPTPERIAAAANQSEFYGMVWNQDQQRLFELYLEDIDDVAINRTTNATSDAFERSIRDATGRYSCAENTSATAWFWFTVMTTIGYGNQAPATLEGRALVATMGSVSILAFGGILLNAGYILAVIVDDSVKRCRMGALSHPLLGVFVWGCIAAAWTFFIGARSNDWWNKRLEDPDVSDWDPVWFAFISTTTVGLGDFFLQPEVMFLQDVLRWSFIFLTAFVFWSTFIGKLAALIQSIFPDSGNKLKDRIRLTNMWNMKENGDSADEASRKDLEYLRKMIEKKEDGHRETHPSTLYEKEEALKTLLEQVSAERRHMEHEEGGLRGMLKAARQMSHMPRRINLSSNS